MGIVYEIEGLREIKKIEQSVSLHHCVNKYAIIGETGMWGNILDVWSTSFSTKKSKKCNLESSN